MFIFKSKNQKKINKIYKEIEKEYRKLDTLKEALWNSRFNEENSNALRADIESVSSHIQELKKEIIKLESWYFHKNISYSESIIIRRWNYE